MVKYLELINGKMAADGFFEDRAGSFGNVHPFKRAVHGVEGEGMYPFVNKINVFFGQGNMIGVTIHESHMPAAGRHINAVAGK